ncbi:MAG: cytochrome c3 family protein [Nitrospirota bacterium]
MVNRAIKWRRKFATSFGITVKLIKNLFGRRLIKTCFVIIPLATANYGSATIQSVAPHDFSGDCFGCHFTVPQPGDPRPYQFVESVSALCLKCHTELNAISHYVNAASKSTYDPTFPVVDPTLLTCATCHDPHMAFVNATTGAKTYLLRAGVSGKAFCAKCHGKIDPLGYTDCRAAMDKAHGFSKFTTVGVFTYTITDDHIQTLSWLRNPNVAIDSLSAECFGCHDDPANPELTTPGSMAFKSGTNIGLSHAIGISYADAVSNDKEIRPAVNPRLMLFDGKLGCCTCHDPYNIAGPKTYRIGDINHQTDLCEACHAI